MFDWDRCSQIADKIRASSDGISFLSEILLDDEDLEFICDNSRMIVFSDKPSLYVLTAYIMVIAGRKYDDGGYWPHLCELLGIDDLSQNERLDLQKDFNQGLSDIGLRKDNVKTPRNIEQFLIHTVVPDTEDYMNNFFSFICSFYKDVLNFELPDDYTESFELLSAIVNGEVQSNQFPSPRALNQCTKYALSDPSNYDKIMIKILKIIDAGYSGRKISGLGNNRFAIPFQKWYVDNIGSRSRNSLSREKEMRRARMYLSSGKVKVLIPAMKCTCNPDLIVKNGRKVIKEIPIKTFPVKVKDSIIYKMTNDLNLEFKDLGVGPFDKFQIELDGHTLLSSSSKDFLLFNEDEVRIKTLNIGINHILVKDQDIIPSCETSVIQKEEAPRLFICDLKEGDEVKIGDMCMTVMPADSSAEGINIFPLENVVAVSEMEVLPVCSDLDCLCLVTNVTASSRIVVKITVDDNPPYHKALKTSPDNVNSGVFATRLVKDEHTSSGIHTVFMELRHNDIKINDSKFILASGYGFRFDSKRGAYVEETEGQLFYSGPIDGSVSFPTTDDSVDVTIPGSDMVFSHKIPALRIRTGDDKWHSPGEYDIRINDFVGDYLWVSSVCNSNLFFNGKPIPRHLAEDNYAYDFHRIHELYNSDKIRNIELEVSLESKPRFHLCNIWLCNYYSAADKGEHITMSVIRHTDNKIVVSVPESGDRFEFAGDSFSVKKPDRNTFHIVVEEKDLYGMKHVVFNEMFIKEEICVEGMTDRTCKISCHGNVVELSYDKKTVSEIMKDYDNKARFSPWMKKYRAAVSEHLDSLLKDK